MSDSENDLFGDENTSPAPEHAPSPGGSPGGSPPRRRADPDEEDDNANELFGDSDNEAPPRGARSPSTRASTPDSTRRLEYPEAEEEVETSEVVADVPVPTWPRMTATDSKVWHVKLPNYVNVQPRPFDAEHYRRDLSWMDGGEGEGEGARARDTMIRVRNTVRWRWVSASAGGVERQSNARMLRWSDGSMSLQIGSDLYDLSPSYGTTLARKADAAPPPPAGGARDTTFVCVTAPNEQVLVTEAAIEGKLAVVPTSMNSKTHRELVKHVGSQHEKHSRMMILDDVADKNTLSELLKRTAPQRAAAPKPSASRSRTGQRSVADSLGGRRGDRFKREASDESDFDERDRRRARDRSYDADDGFVVADSDDEGYPPSGSSKKKKKKAKRSKRRNADYDDTEDEEDADDLDETELADRRIEEAERAKRGKGGKKRARDYVESEDEDAEGEDAEMDVESEDE